MIETRGPKPGLAEVQPEPNPLKDLLQVAELG
jgi:hypothetical protein